MAATEAQIARLRRMIAEPAETTYSDEVLSEYVERYPLPDTDGYLPSDADWTPTYDLNAAAADLWQEKAANLVANGQIYEADSVHLQAMRQVRYYMARRTARSVKASNRDKDEEPVS